MTMNPPCGFHARLDAFLDGELSESERADFEKHLPSCASCASEAVGRMRLSAATRLAGRRYTPDPRFLGRVTGALSPSISRRWVFPLAAAAAVVLAAGVAFFAVQRTNREQACAELADLHAANLAAASRVEIASSDRHVVKPWFQGRVPFAVTLPDTLPPPFRLAGGRVTFVDQLPAAHLLFEARQHQISVFVVQDRPEMRRRFGGGARTVRTYRMRSWGSGGLRWVVLGDAEPPALEDLSRALGE